MALRRREQKKNRSRKKNRSSTPEDRASAKHTIDVVKKGNDRVIYIYIGSCFSGYPMCHSLMSIRRKVFHYGERIFPHFLTKVKLCSANRIFKKVDSKSLKSNHQN